MTVTTRWECSNCQNICSTRPFFNIYHKETGKLLRGSKGMITAPPGYEFKCIDCGCAPKYHSFTFKKPKEEKNGE